jgi:hypothetical protein
VGCPYDLLDASGQLLGRAPDADVASGEDRAEGGLLHGGLKPPHQDRGHRRCRPASSAMRHDPIHGDLHAPGRDAVARPHHVRHDLGLLGLTRSLPRLEVLRRAVDEALSPPRAEGHARTPRQEVMGDSMGQFGDHRRLERTHIVAAVPDLRDAQIMVIRPEGRPTSVTREGPHGDAHFAQ